MEICDKEGDENDKNEEGERKEAKARWYETSQTTEEVIKEKFHEEKNPIDDEALTDPEGLEEGNTQHKEISDEKIVSNEEITDDNAPSCNPSEPRGCCQCTREEFRKKTKDIFLTYFLLFGIVFSIGLAAGESGSLRKDRSPTRHTWTDKTSLLLSIALCRSLSSPWCGVPRSTDHCDVCGRDLYFLASRDHFEVLTTTECLQELQGESETGGNAEQQ